MKKLGIVISLCIHVAYSIISGLMVLGYLDSMKNGTMLSDAIPEGSGMIGLLILVVMGALLVGGVLLLGISLMAVLFEVLDLIFDKRGFAFVYFMISLGFLLFIGSMGLDMAIELLLTQGLDALASVEMAVLALLGVTAVFPTVVGASRLFHK